MICQNCTSKNNCHCFPWRITGCVHHLQDDNSTLMCSWMACRCPCHRTCCRSDCSEKISPKDIWDRLYECRQFELENLWRRSVFLWTLLALVLTGYGCFLSLDKSTIAPSTLNGKLIGVGFGIIITLLGFIFFCLAKGSKYWYEVYEEKIKLFERKSDAIAWQYRYENTDVNPNETLTSSFLGKERYSPSKINILLGVLISIIGFIIFSAHLIDCLYNVTPAEILSAVDPSCVILLFLFLGIIILLNLIHFTLLGGHRQ